MNFELRIASVVIKDEHESPICQSIPATTLPISLLPLRQYIRKAEKQLYHSFNY